MLRSTFTVPAGPQAVYDHLMRAENWVGLSPLVVEVREVTAEGYTAVERLRFLGRFTRDNLIKVTLRGEPGEAVWGEVDSPGGVTLKYRFTLREHASGTLVEDTLELKTPPGLLRFAAGQARKVQAARPGILRARLG